MAENNRLIGTMTDLLAEVHQMHIDNNERLATTNGGLNRLKTQTAKNNAAIGELRVSVVQPTDKIKEIYYLDQRVRVLENIVLPKPQLQAA